MKTSVMKDEELEQLAKLRDNLETSIDALGSWLIGFIVIIVLGLVIEVLRYVVLLRAQFDLWTLAEVIGTSLVTLGVAGELFVESTAHRKENRLRTVNQDIEEAGKQRIAVLQLQTEQLRKENNETAILLGYRSIGDPLAFQDAMRPYSGTKFTIQFIPSEEECVLLQWKIRRALTSAEWVPLRTERSRANLQFGVSVLTVSQPNPSVRCGPADALADWLHSNNNATMSGMIADESVELNTVVTQIGRRPETIEQHEQMRAEYLRRRTRP